MASQRIESKQNGNYDYDQVAHYGQSADYNVHNQNSQQEVHKDRSASPAPSHHTNMSTSNNNNELVKYKKDLLVILGKFASAHTQQQGANELKRLMKHDITDNDRMIIFLNSLGTFSEHMNLNQMKVQIQ